MKAHEMLLLVEDMPVVQELYASYLKKHGFKVDVAADGKEALSKTANKKYDFVLVDLLLPELNGLEFLEQFKNRPPETQVLVLSDFQSPDTVEQARRLDVAKYLIKAENTPSQLVDLLREMSKPKN